MSFPHKRPPPKDRSDEFASFKAAPTPARMVTAADLWRAPATKAVTPKTPDRKKQSIRDSARDEECLIRVPGCPGDPAMTIWSHNRHQRAGKGGALKALDLNGAYGCTYCDAVYDGQRPLPPGVERWVVELAWFMAHAESLVRLRQKGLV